MANTVFNIKFRMTGISIPLLAVDITGRRLMMTSRIYIASKIRMSTTLSLFRTIILSPYFSFKKINYKVSNRDE